MFRVSTMWHFIIDTQPIGSKRQSHLRLLQLLRSAADQVSGWLDDDKVSRQVDPQGQGGGWHQDSEDSGSEQVFYEGPVAGRESYRYNSYITHQRCSNLWSKALNFNRNLKSSVSFIFLNFLIYSTLVRVVWGQKLNNHFICKTRLPQANIRWVRLTLSSLCQLFKGVPPINLINIKRIFLGMPIIKPGAARWDIYYIHDQITSKHRYSYSVLPDYFNSQLLKHCFPHSLLAWRIWKDLGV